MITFDHISDSSKQINIKSTLNMNICYYPIWYIYIYIYIYIYVYKKKKFLKVKSQVEVLDEVLIQFTHTFI